MQVGRLQEHFLKPGCRTQEWILSTKRRESRKSQLEVSWNGGIPKSSIWDFPLQTIQLLGYPHDEQPPVLLLGPIVTPAHLRNTHGTHDLWPCSLHREDTLGGKNPWELKVKTMWPSGQLAELWEITIFNISTINDHCFPFFFNSYVKLPEAIHKLVPELHLNFVRRQLCMTVIAQITRSSVEVFAWLEIWWWNDGSWLATGSEIEDRRRSNGKNQPNKTWELH